MKWFIYILSIGSLLAQGLRDPGFVGAAGRVPPSGGPLVTNTIYKGWIFTGNAEELQDGAATGNIAFAYNGANAVSWTTTTKQQSGVEEYARTNSDTGNTWELLGVPSGATVIACWLTNWQDMLIASNLWVGLTNTFDIINSSGTTVLTGGTLTNFNKPAGTNATFQERGFGPERAVDSAYQASSTSVRLQITWKVWTGGPSGSANIIQWMDNIWLGIKYYQ